MKRIPPISVLVLPLAAAVILLCGGCDGNSPEGVNRKALQEIARLGNGFVIWERFRHGRWQIWSKRIDGTGERRLVPLERRRDHFCPKVSPDGNKLAYLSFRQGETAYQRTTNGSLWIYDMLSKKRRKLAIEARSYAEDRAVIWFDDNTLCYIDGEGYTVELNIETGATSRLTQEGDPDFGWLVNSTKTYATTGTPEFSPYHSDTKTIDQQNRHAGCQPYFTRDGKWGYWMSGAGGPMNRMRLSTRLIERVIEKNDKRLDPDWNYIYFPMISPCRRLIAFGASRGDHDHFTADYEIFLARLHPQTLELRGEPVRFTDSPSNDRFPDVFREELPLGSHFVEGASQIAFHAPDPGDWEWDFDNGQSAQGHHATGRFSKPGEYWIEAHSGIHHLHGYVCVTEPAPPRVVALRRQGADDLLLHFNEPVDASGAQISLDTGEKFEKWKAINENMTLVATLPAGAPKHDSVVIDRVSDHAQKPNAMPRTVLRIPGQEWPAATDGLAFAWSDNEQENKMEDGFVCHTEPRGRAFWNEHHAMVCGGGMFLAPGAGERISKRCGETGAISVEMILNPLERPMDGQMRVIMSVAESAAERNVTLGQKNGMLTLWLGTSDNGARGNRQEPALCSLTPGMMHHVVFYYRKGGRLGLVVDGEDIRVRSKLEGDFAHWKPERLSFGAAPDGSSAWRGIIEGVAVYDRVVDEEEALEHFASAEVLLGKRGVTPQWEVRARLVETSRTPSLQEIQPYKQALVKHRYEVLGVEKGGAFPHQEILVAHWAWLDGEAMPAQRYKAGEEVRLTVQPYEVHQEIKNLVTREDLTGGFDAAQFFDVGWATE